VTKPVFKTTGSKPLTDYAVELAEGDFVFKEGDLGTDMFIVHSGKIEILQRVDEEDKQLAVLEKGDFFGEMSVLEDLPRSASARALSDVRLLQINSATFSQMLRDNPEIAVRMMRKLSRRLRQTDKLLREALSAAGKPPPTPAEMPPQQPPPEASAPERLIDPRSGMEFPFAAGSETTIGRKDPVTGIYPDIDLTPVDTQRSISRRHAKIYRRGAKFFLAEEIGTMNGTFVNGNRLETGVPSEIRPGDEVRFGMVVLSFRVERSSGGSGS
jgi:hypothetical protein